MIVDINIENPKFFSLNCKHIVPRLTYEDYLIDVVNYSMFFKSKCNYENYHLESNQSNGENDIISSTYCMDFKLIIDQETMRSMGKNKPEVDYSKIKQGFINVKTKTDEHITPFRNILFELLELKEFDLQDGVVNETINSLIKNLKKDKNLFLYYPYEFNCKNDIYPSKFENIFTKAFVFLMIKRTDMFPGRDTFLCIKINSNFIIYEWYANKFVYRDKVPDILCTTYRDVKLYSVY